MAWSSLWSWRVIRKLTSSSEEELHEKAHIDYDRVAIVSDRLSTKTVSLATLSKLTR